MSFGDDDICKECGLPFMDCQAVKNYDEEDDPCVGCAGTGMEFEGDVHVGDCTLCGGAG